jgi:hypothetical protein
MKKKAKTIRIDLAPRNVIENGEGQVRMVRGPKAIEAYQLRTLIVALDFEGRTKMRMTRGASALTRARQFTGLRTTDREKLKARLRKLLDERLSECLIVDKDELYTEAE